MKNFKISIVTVSFNSEKTINNTIQSIKSQKYSNFEHIIVDGFSTDDTVKIIQREIYPNLKFISEKDFGIYDAMNKGFKMVTGEIVAFLNSDDIYANETVFNQVINAFKNFDINFVYGNLIVQDPKGNILRHWKPGSLSERGLTSSQIPHPCLFVRKCVLDKIVPTFDDKLKISADIKQQLIFINKLGYKGLYLDSTISIMSNGGVSTNSFGSFLLGWKETMDSYNEIFGSGGLLFTVKKIISKFKGVKKFSLITKR